MTEKPEELHQTPSKFNFLSFFFFILIAALIAGTGWMSYHLQQKLNQYDAVIARLKQPQSVDLSPIEQQLDALKTELDLQKNKAAENETKFNQFTAELGNAANPVTAECFQGLTELGALLPTLELNRAQQTAPGSESEPIAPEEIWWKKGLNESYALLKQVVVVRKLDANEKPFIFPEEKSILLHQMQSSISFAKWGLLHHDHAVYESSLNELIAWVNAYFNPSTDAAKTVLEKLESLKSKYTGNS